MKIESGSGGQMSIFWGQSANSFDDAVAEAVNSARNALAGSTLEWLEVIEFRGGFHSDGSLQYQVSVRVGYA